jgi:hypothetical protein
MAKSVQRYASEDGNDSKSEDGHGSKQLQLIMVSGTLAILIRMQKRCD